MSESSAPRPPSPQVPAVPYLCPFCGEEDPEPADGGRWLCPSCGHLFSVTLHAVVLPGAPPGTRTMPATPPPTPASGIRLVDRQAGTASPGPASPGGGPSPARRVVP